MEHRLISSTKELSYCYSLTICGQEFNFKVFVSKEKIAFSRAVSLRYIHDLSNWDLDLLVSHDLANTSIKLIIIVKSNNILSVSLHLKVLALILEACSISLLTTSIYSLILVVSSSIGNLMLHLEFLGCSFSLSK